MSCSIQAELPGLLDTPLFWRIAASVLWFYVFLVDAAIIVVEESGFVGIWRMYGMAETDDLVLGYAEAAEFLHVSRRTLERYVREGLVPHVRLPKRGAWSGTRFLRSQLTQWLQFHTVKTARGRRAV